jgi:DNA-binding CsgD family transcriptional regulator/PAS domain-containing protein
MLPSSEVLSELLDGLYAAAADPALWDSFLQELAHNTRASSAALLMYDASQEVYALSSSFKLDPEGARLYQQYYGSMDIWAQRGLTRSTGFVCNSEALIPLAEMAATEIYNDFMIRFDVEHAMFGVVENTGARLASVSLYRSSSSSEFHGSEQEILHFLLPHLQRAFKLHFQFSALKAQQAGLEAALDMLPTGVILLGAKSEVVLMNRSAAALVAEKDGLLATRDGLRAEQPMESALLAKAIQRATLESKRNELCVGGTVLVSRRDRSPLQVLISPIRNSTISTIYTAQPIAAIAFVIDPTRQQRPTHNILRGLFGLTPAECRVALLLGDGHAPKVIAGMVGVSVETVRSQIKSIFAKTNVKRQSALIRILMNNSGLGIQEIGLKRSSQIS